MYNILYIYNIELAHINSNNFQQPLTYCNIRFLQLYLHKCKENCVKQYQYYKKIYIH